MLAYLCDQELLPGFGALRIVVQQSGQLQYLAFADLSELPLQSQ